jgi:large subunit ribosomal protein L17
MRHQKKARKLGRSSNQRRALFRSLLSSLILKEKIITTEAKAKEVKRKIDRILNRARNLSEETKKVATLRLLRKELSPSALKKISGEFRKRFEKRKSGCARVIKLSPGREDKAKMAVLEFVD